MCHIQTLLEHLNHVSPFSLRRISENPTRYLFPVSKYIRQKKNAQKCSSSVQCQVHSDGNRELYAPKSADTKYRWILLLCRGSFADNIRMRHEPKCTIYISGEVVMRKPE